MTRAAIHELRSRPDFLPLRLPAGAMDGGAAVNFSGAWGWSPAEEQVERGRASPPFPGERQEKEGAVPA